MDARRWTILTWGLLVAGVVQIGIAVGRLVLRDDTGGLYLVALGVLVALGSLWIFRADRKYGKGGLPKACFAGFYRPLLILGIGALAFAIFLTIVGFYLVSRNAIRAGFSFIAAVCFIYAGVMMLRQARGFPGNGVDR